MTDKKRKSRPEARPGSFLADKTSRPASTLVSTWLTVLEKATAHSLPSFDFFRERRTHARTRRHRWTLRKIHRMQLAALILFACLLSLSTASTSAENGLRSSAPHAGIRDRKASSKLPGKVEKLSSSARSQGRRNSTENDSMREKRRGTNGNLPIFSRIDKAIDSPRVQNLEDKVYISEKLIVSEGIEREEEKNSRGEIENNFSKEHFSSNQPETAEKVRFVPRFGKSVAKSEIKVDREEDFEPREEDMVEAANYGLQSMYELYYVKEPKWYSMGLYLDADNPARYVAAFNDQTEEARNLAKFGFAVLEGATQFVKKFPNAPKELPSSRNSQRSPLQRQCPRRERPLCPPASLRYRTSDGSCNNLQNLWWGSAMSTMQRFLPPVYQDGIQGIRKSKTGRPLPSAREISNVIHKGKDVPLTSITHMLMQWGQFVDHDLTATGQSRGFNGTIPQCCLDFGVGFQPPEFMHPECLPIPVNLQDSFFGPLGVRCLEFLRSGPAPREDCEFGPREQLSQVTSYLDASTVYSSNALQSDSLRIFRNGLLQYGKIQSRRPLLPKRNSDLCKRGSLSTSCFKAGDGRLSEQPALTSLHIVFLRLHNRIATKLAALNSHWSDEKLFQETRRIVGAVIQHITYREFLPIILGPNVMKIFDLEVLRKGYYKGYDQTVNPTVANAFSTAAYRFGHSLVQRSFVRFDVNHKPLFNNVSIHDEFSNPVNLETAGSVDRVILGLINQPAQKRDEFITEELTNHLFQTPRFPFGMDLASLNVQRGRDHGLPPYVDWRKPCGLSPIESFEDLERTMPTSTAKKFQLLYSFVEDIDLFPAGLAEKSVSGGLVGPTFACLIAQQFGNLRRGDRFWYENGDGENSFTPAQLQQIRKVSLAQVLCKTMDDVETIQPFVFLIQDNLRNQRVSCDDPAIGKLDLDFWVEAAAELRNPNFQKARRKPGSQLQMNTSPKPNSGSSDRRASVEKEQTKLLPQRQKPVKSNIHQQNKIVVKRPLGPSDNVTIVVNNNAVNAPLFVNDAIFGSNIRIQETTEKNHRPTFAQSSIFQRPPNGIGIPIQGIPVYMPSPKPIPTTLPSLSRDPYVPHAFDDPSNPNPLNHGFKNTGDIYFDDLHSFIPTSPRPTLYTYYTNFLQKTTTSSPDLQIDRYLINYSTNNRPYQESRPENYLTSKPSSNAAPISRPYNQFSMGNSGIFGRPSFGEHPQVETNGDFNTRPNWSNLSHQKPINIQNEEYPSYGSSSNSYDVDRYPHRKRPISKPTTSNDAQPIGYQSSGNNRPFYHEIWRDKPYQTWSTKPQVDDNTWSTVPPWKKGHGEYNYDSSYQAASTRPDLPDEKRPNIKLYVTQSNFDEFASLSPYRRPTSGPMIQKDDPSSFPKPLKGPSLAVNDSPKVSAYPKGPFTDGNEEIENGGFYQGPAKRPNEGDNWERAPPYRDGPTFPSKFWSQSSAGFYTYRPEEYSKPTKSVTIVKKDDARNEFERIEVSSELPMPLTSKEAEKRIRKPGYYYNEDAIHRYPDEKVSINNDYTSDVVVEKQKAVERQSTLEPIVDDAETNAQVIQSDDGKLTTTPTIVIGEDNDRDDVDYDLEGAFSEVVESVEVSDADDSTIRWLYTEDNSTHPTSQMPKIMSGPLASAEELPKPIALRPHAS